MKLIGSFVRVRSPTRPTWRGDDRTTPALDDTHPAAADAPARVSPLAKAHASAVSCDWYGPTALVPV
jgi:hypothetical protein